MTTNQQPTGNDQARNVQSSGPQQPASISLSEAARLLAERRSALRQQPAPTPQTGDEGSAPPETDEVEGEAQVEDQPEGEVAEAELQPDGEEQAAEEATYGDDAVLDLDGEEVSLGEIKKWREGAMRQEDYQRKTQVLSQKMQAVTAVEERLNAFSHAINRDFQMRMEAVQRGMQQFREIDWVKLAANPAEYNQKKVMFEQARAAEAALKQQWTSFLQEYERVSQETLEQRARAAIPELRSRIKGWDDAVYTERYNFAKDTYGADPAVLAKVVDPWFWEMANDAYLYRAGKKLAQQKVKRALPRPLKAGSTSARPAQGTEVKRLEKTLQTMPQTTNLRQREDAALKLMQARRQKSAPRR